MNSPVSILTSRVNLETDRETSAMCITVKANLYGERHCGVGEGQTIPEATWFAVMQIVRRTLEVNGNGVFQVLASDVHADAHNRRHVYLLIGDPAHQNDLLEGEGSGDSELDAAMAAVESSVNQLLSH